MIKKKKIRKTTETEVADDDLEEVKEVKKPKTVKAASSKLKSKASALKETVAKEVDEIDEQLEELNDNTWVNTYEAMFKRLRSIMLKVENKVLGSEIASSQDIYALMALYNQMREVVADIRSIIDLTQNTQKIIDSVLYPLVRDISNNYVDAIFMIKKTLRANVESNKYIELKSEVDNCLREHAKYIQSAYEKSSEKLTSILEE